MTRIRWSLLLGLVFGLGAVTCGESGSAGNGSKPARGGGSGDGGESTGGSSGSSGESGASGAPSTGGGNGGNANGGTSRTAGEGGHPSGGGPDADGGEHRITNALFVPAMGVFRRIRDHYRVIQLVSGAVLVVLGLLLFFDRFWWLRVYLNRFFRFLGIDA